MATNPQDGVPVVPPVGDSEYLMRLEASKRTGDLRDVMQRASEVAAASGLGPSPLSGGRPDPSILSSRPNSGTLVDRSADFRAKLHPSASQTKVIPGDRTTFYMDQVTRRTRPSRPSDNPDHCYVVPSGPTPA